MFKANHPKLWYNSDEKPTQTFHWDVVVCFLEGSFGLYGRGLSLLVHVGFSYMPVYFMSDDPEKRIHVDSTISNQLWNTIAGWWSGTFFPYIENNHPN